MTAFSVEDDNDLRDLREMCIRAATSLLSQHRDNPHISNRELAEITFGVIDRIEVGQLFYLSNLIQEEPV